MREYKAQKKWKYVWWTIKTLAFIGCIVLSVGLGFAPLAYHIGLSLPVAISLAVVLGVISVPWKALQNTTIKLFSSIKIKIKKLKKAVKNQEVEEEKQSLIEEDIQEYGFLEGMQKTLKLLEETVTEEKVAILNAKAEIHKKKAEIHKKESLRLKEKAYNIWMKKL